MINGTKWDFKGLFYRRRKHYCSKCGELLSPFKQEKVVNSKSDEAKYYDFKNGDTYLIGGVKFVKFAFKCLVCNTQYSIDEQKSLERNIKNKNNSVDVLAEVTNTRFNKISFGAIYNGCCEIKKNYRTSCIIETLDNNPISLEQTTLCKVSFITPNLYPASIWVGKVLELYEEIYRVGVLKITQIINPVLDRNCVFEDKPNILYNYELLNKGLKLSLERGKEFTKPLNNKIMCKIQCIKGNDIEKVASYIISVRDDILWRIYYDHYDTQNENFTVDVKKAVSDKYPWIDKDNLSSLDSQGKFYAWHG